MSVYIRELLIDSYGIGIPIETVIDIRLAIERLYRNGVLTRLDIELLKLYCYGYSVQALSSVYPNAYQRLLWTLTQLEHETGIKDSIIVDIGLAKYGHLSIVRRDLEKKLADLSTRL